MSDKLVRRWAGHNVLLTRIFTAIFWMQGDHMRIDDPAGLFASTLA